MLNLYVPPNMSTISVCLSQRLEMAHRQRSLPSWMTKEEEKMKKNEPQKNRKKRKTASAIFYCMNEKELVEAADSILHDAPCEDVFLLSGRAVADVPEAEDSAMDNIVKIKEKCFTSEKTEKLAMEEGQSLDRSHVEDTTCVSEPDLDVTQLETLPYASSPLQQKPVGQRSGPVQDCNDLLDVELEKEGNAQMAAEAEEEDEDGLQLVREIFFS